MPTLSIIPETPSEKDYMGSISREMTEDDIETTIRNFEAAANIALAVR